MPLFTSRGLSSFVISVSAARGILTDRLWGVMSPLGQSFKIAMATVRWAASGPHGERLQSKDAALSRAQTPVLLGRLSHEQISCYGNPIKHCIRLPKPKAGCLSHDTFVQLFPGCPEHLIHGARHPASTPQQKYGTYHNDSVLFFL